MCISISLSLCSFEQEVLGGPVAGGPQILEAVPLALAVPVMRPIIGTNTYRQVCADPVVSGWLCCIRTDHCRVIKLMFCFSVQGDILLTKDVIFFIVYIHDSFSLSLSLCVYSLFSPAISVFFS